MRPVHFYAGQRHYFDHLAPIWHALEPCERGRFFVATAALAAHAHRAGVDVVTARAFPTERRTMYAGRQPVWVVAGIHDYRMTGARRRVVLVEHGTGQTYNGDPASAGNHGYAGGRNRGRVVLFLCPNERTAQANLRAYPRTPAVVVGCPKLDAHPEEYVPHEYRWPRQPTVAFSFHWDCPASPEAGWAFHHYKHALAELAADADLHLLGHGHPRAFRPLAHWYDVHGIPPVEHFDDVLQAADLYVCDNSSTLYEFAAHDRPVIVLNAPEYRRHVEHGLRFWAMADVGVQVNEGSSLRAAIARTLADDPQRERRRQITAELYPWRDGQAARRAADAMRTHLP